MVKNQGELAFSLRPKENEMLALITAAGLSFARSAAADVIVGGVNFGTPGTDYDPFRDSNHCESTVFTRLSASQYCQWNIFYCASMCRAGSFHRTSNTSQVLRPRHPGGRRQQRLAVVLSSKTDIAIWEAEHCGRLR